MQSSRTAVIVQARMTSTRLPGKVLADLAGKPVLAHVLQRCLAIPGVHAVCCATVDGSEGDQIATLAESLGVVVTRGSRDDVLDRYFRAALTVHADTVVRVTSDCPLIDPNLCGRVLSLLHQSGADLACNNMPPTWPYGLDCEAFTFAWLERAARQAVKPADREHVTPFIRNHPEARKVNLPGPTDYGTRQRWTVDYPEDLQFMRKLFARLPEGPESFDYRIPLELLRRDTPSVDES